MRRLVSLLVIALLAPACGGDDKPDEPLPRAAGELRLTSPAFGNGAAIPKRYTCDGPGVSPPLSWSGVPRQARELALLVEDLDAGRFVHWTVVGIPASRTRIDEGRVPRRVTETENGFGRRGWGGPCPPEGDEPHRYVFALYAVDAALGLDQDSPPNEVRGRLAEHSLARGLLTARFGR